MKTKKYFYLLKASVRDGENEYWDFYLINTDKKIEIYGDALEKVLKENFDTEVTRDDFNNCEIDGDYRIWEVISIQLLNKQELKAVKKLVTSYVIEI